MTQASFPDEYDTAAARRVVINQALIPLVAGALAYLEKPESWLTDADYEAAYNAIAELQIAMSHIENAEHNTVLAGPTAGDPAPAEFRQLAPADIPYLPVGILTSGVLPVALGGTGADLSATGSAYSVVQQKAPGDSFWVAPLVAPHIPNLDASKITTGVMPVARGGTGVAAAPAFRAWIGSNQTIAPATFTKIAASTEARDTNNNYDPALARFTPLTAGTYLFTAYAVFLAPTQDTKGFGLYLYKNGARSFSVENILFSPSAGDFAVQLAGQLDADGDDFFELYAYSQATINVVIWSGAGSFSAIRIGP